MSRLTRHIATAIAALLGVTGLILMLYTWGLPPFRSSIAVTDDAYIRGQITAIAPQSAGPVAEVRVQDFETVAAGDLLVRLDDRILREKLAQAEATLAQQRAALANSTQDERSAQANIRATEARASSAAAALEVARANRERAEELLKRGVMTQVDVEQQRLAHDQASATLAQVRAELEAERQAVQSILVGRGSLQAAVAGAEAAVQLARIDLDNTRITAPVAGRLGEVGARVGQYVTAGTRLTTLVPDRLWVIANFKETQVAGMREGQPVGFTVDALPGQSFTGRIERFSPATGSEFSVIRADNATGNFIKVSQRVPIRIAIDPGQPGTELLAPGLSVVASIDRAPEADGAR